MLVTVPGAFGFMVAYHKSMSIDGYTISVQSPRFASHFTVGQLHSIGRHGYDHFSSTWLLRTTIGVGTVALRVVGYYTQSLLADAV
jgi:hypothetical protein